MKKALIIQGGWSGHEPVQVAEIFRKTLEKEGFAVEVSNTLDVLLDNEKVRGLHLLVPVWTMGEITKDQSNSVSEAVADGMGIAGCHGGMCDAFRKDTQWQFITGANWVSHPGGGEVEYTVNIKRGSSPITQGINDFKIKSEQYYLHVDPAIEVLATTRFPTANWYHASNGMVDVPQVWTKRWGIGRVFYSALGHIASVFDIHEPMELMRRGFLWAAEGREIAVREGLNGDAYRNKDKMF